jgi:hypothetical protein
LEILGAPSRMDNKLAINLAKNPVYHGHSKHIWIRYHFVRECAIIERIEIQFVGMNDQLAHILTKPLLQIKFEEIKQRIGAKEIK